MSEFSYIVDCVSFPKRSSVFLVHTDNLYGIGIVKVPYDHKFLIAHLRNPLHRNSFSISKKFLVNMTDVSIAKDEEEATILSANLLDSWCRKHIGAEANPHRVVQFRDEPSLNKPQFTGLGHSRLSRNEEASGVQVYLNTSAAGFDVPLSPLIELWRNDLV